MKILYFDCFSGISGDMSLGALLDLGIDAEEFKTELAKLNLEGYEIFIDRRNQYGIEGTDVKVVLKDENTHHIEDHMHHHSRNLLDIEKLIDHSSLSEKVKEFSKKVFREIAAAEAKVHGKSINDVHFHEVGAVDSIVDIVGAAICLDLLGAEKVYSSSLHDGYGQIECQHGIMPVPVPAVVEMLSESNIAIVPENVNTELVTPTGLGIIKCLSESFGNMPAMTINKVGYGFGKKNIGRLNALRIIDGSLLQ